MKILALDTSTTTGGIAVKDGDRFVIFEEWQQENSHAEIVTAKIEENLAKANLKLSEIDGFAVDIGPGSFTGLRIGINVVKSFCYLWEKPVFAYNSLEIMAAAVNDSSLPIATIMNAYSNMLFLATFNKQGDELKEELSPRAVSPADLNEHLTTEHLCVGEGYGVFSNQLEESVLRLLKRSKAAADTPSSKILASLAQRDFGRAQALVWNDLDALYIRASGAEEKLKKGILKPLPKL